MNEQYITMGAK